MPSKNENVTIRIDSEVRKQADELFGQMGLTMTAAVNAFLRSTLQAGKLPFEIKGNDRAFWDKAEEGVLAAMKRAQSSEAKWLSTDEVFTEVDALLDEMEKNGGKAV